MTLAAHILADAATTVCAATTTAETIDTVAFVNVPTADVETVAKAMAATLHGAKHDGYGHISWKGYSVWVMAA